MFDVFLGEALLNDYPQHCSDDMFIVFGLVAKDLELFLLEEKQTIGGADFFGFAIDARDLGVD